MTAAPPAARAPRTVVLLDIDGTLLHVHGAGRRSFIRALEEVYGWRDDIAYINFSGATDLDVLRRILERHGRAESPAETDRFFECLARELEAGLRDAQVTVYPGVRELVRTLAADPRVIVGLVTGNVESCARLKLKAAGLDGHVLLGAFGHEHADRREIARLAVGRVRRHAGAHADLRLFLIGDTPADIEAARTIGAACVAVATGKHTVDELKHRGADHALTDLADLPAVLRILGLD